MYSLQITVSHYDDYSGDALNSFNCKYGNDQRVHSHHAEVVEHNHISGLLGFFLIPEEYVSIVGQVTQIIADYDLHGECFSILDSKGNSVATEEDSI